MPAWSSSWRSTWALATDSWKEGVNVAAVFLWSVLKLAECPPLCPFLPACWCTFNVVLWVCAKKKEEKKEKNGYQASVV